MQQSPRRAGRLLRGLIGWHLVMGATHGLCAAAGGATAEAVAAYRHPVIDAPRCGAPPTIDGVIDDPCWSAAYHTDRFWNTASRRAPCERTEAWFCLDRHAVYVAVHAHDSHPHEVKCQETKRGGNIWSDDYIEIGIDADHAGDRLFWFQVTANGTQHDDIPGGSDAKIEWRGDWTGASRRVPDGWTMEARIPFAILRYPAGQSVWGLNIARNYPRTGEWWNWPPQPELFNGHEIAEIRGLQLPRLTARPVIMPHVQTEFADGHFGARIGVDAKYTHPGGMTGVAAWNPDFRDIENDVESIDFSYTERQYSERRPFFVEGSDFLPPTTMLYTRRIPELDLGAKVFGTHGRTSIGVLDARAFGERNDAAVQVRQRIARDSEAALAYVGTEQRGLANDTYHARATYSDTRDADRQLTLKGDVYQTRTRGGEGGGLWRVYGSGSLGDGRPRGWAEYRRVDRTFVPADGYAPDIDLAGVSGGLTLSSSFLGRRTECRTLALTGGDYDRLDGTHYHTDLAASYGVDYREGRSWQVGWSRSDRLLSRDHTWSASVSWNTKTLNRNGSADVVEGREDGARYRYWDVWQGLKLRDGLFVNLGYEARTSDYAGRDRDQHLWRTTASLNYDIDRERTIAGRLLTGSEGTNLFLSYRQEVRTGMDLFVILGDPNAGATEGRIAVKAKWTYR